MRNIEKASGGYTASLNVEMLESRTLLSSCAIAGSMFDDFNGDRVREANDTPEGGFGVFLDLNHNGMLDSADVRVFSDASGNFLFPNLTPGTYSVRQNTPAGYKLTVPSAFPLNVTVAAGQTANITIANQPPQIMLNATVIGTNGSYNNQGNTSAKAFDGNLGTYFDAPTPSGSYAGLDLGSPKIVNQISFAPRSGYTSRMVGGAFQASDVADFSTGTITLYTVTSVPVTGSLTTVQLQNSSPYRYVRYLGPANSYCNLAEAQFFGTAPIPGVVLAADGTLTITGTSQPDTINVNFSDVISSGVGTGTFTVTFNGTMQQFDPNLVRRIFITSSDGNDTVTVNDHQEMQDEPSSRSPIDTSVVVGNGNDSVTVNQTDYNFGSQSPSPVNQDIATLISAGNGNNSLVEQGGSFATIIAGNGNNHLSAAAGDEFQSATLRAGDGNDSFSAGSAGSGGLSVGVTGGTGHDSLFNSDPEDSIGGVVEGQNASVTWTGGEVLGRAYVDKNNDGKYDAGDSSIASVTVFLDNNNDGVFDAGDVSTTTDANGNYAFDNLTPGSTNSGQTTAYGIIAIPPTGFSFTTGGGKQSAILSAGEALSGEDFILTKIPTKLAGTAIGTPGSYLNHGATIANAFDGSLSTFFNAPAASGDWVGLDFGAAKVVTQFKYAPAAGHESRMVGGTIQASNTADFSSGVVTLFTITSSPKAGVSTTQTLSNTAAYRYYRYIGPSNSYCNIAELEFDGE